MPKTITRKTLTPFGLTGPLASFAQFGSQAAGAPAKSKDPAVIQSLEAWLAGWQNAVATNNAPFLEDMNAVHFLLSYMQAYQMQEGVAEWDAGTTYFAGSIVKAPGTSQMYGSKIDDNTGNTLPVLTSDANWKYLEAAGSVPIGGIIDYPSATPASGNWKLADGSEVSRASYAELFVLISTGFGVGNGSTTFNLPNYTDRMGVGAGGSYPLTSKGGEAVHILTTAEMPSHSHSVNDPAHRHQAGFLLTAGNGGGGQFYSGYGGGAMYTQNAVTGISIQAYGGGGAHNNMPPYLGMYKMIRVL